MGRPISRPSGRCSPLWLTAAALLIVGTLAAPPEAAAARPNLVLILADDLGYGEIGAFGGREVPTPNIDALARSGTLFTDGYASSPQCAPTRAGLMTGRYQQRFGFHFNPPPPTHPAFQRFGLPAAEVTLASELRRLGYVNGLIGKWHLGFKPMHHPLRRGFDRFFGFLAGGHVYVGDDPDVTFYSDRRVVHERQYLTRAFARESVAFIRRHARKPFFLYAAFNATHLPLQAEAGMVARFGHIPSRKRRIFAAMLAHLDEAVGSIVAALKDRGLLERTVVAFVTDNGCVTAKSSCRNAPFRGGKGMLYEGGIRVPFILSWRGTIPVGRRFRHPVTTLDLFPTFLAAAGAAGADPRLDGVNLLPFVTSHAAGQPHSRLFWGTLRFGAVRQGDWKLLELSSAPVQLYNLRQDPSESRNLAASRPALVDRLGQARRAWAREMLPPRWPPG